MNNLEKTNEDYLNALKLIQSFQKDFKGDELINASNLLLSSLKENKKEVECYVLLAYIFYVFNKEKQSKSCLKIARSINPLFPKIDDLEKLFDSINESLKSPTDVDPNKNIVLETLRLYGAN